ncbi:hypothetical protein HPP92_018429 [Vanilla planifolia]|uniref:SPARK domain-containing protein n=1 Tax=Vanilla planifolia TaxID=51239 RepID=A0A835Q708_VANPL|nr:hypothetical protein HPP92_018429 [Vanilla planifolia]
MLLIIVNALLLSLICPSVVFSSTNEQQHLDPGGSPSVVPTFSVPSIGDGSNRSVNCQLDLSTEMFGSIQQACGIGTRGSLDRSRCCPVLAAWLYAAYSRSALRLHYPSSSPPVDDDQMPIIPETESQRCADAFQASFDAREIRLPRPNATCDTALCFCGIRLHDLGSLSCPAAFNLTETGLKTTSELHSLERDCSNASNAGCTRCLNSLEKLKGEGGEGRMKRMMDRDCRLMGLTWLLARNKSAYIPTVSAVLRAMSYSAHPPTPPYRCNPDQDNMPLAVGSLQFGCAGKEKCINIKGE